MRATVQMRNAHGMYSARTENNILLVFAVAGLEPLALGDKIDVDLPNILSSQRIVRIRDRQSIPIRLKADDIHDLELPARHGGNRMPSPERLKRV